MSPVRCWAFSAKGSSGRGSRSSGKHSGLRTLFGARKGVAGLGPLYTPFDEVLATADVITLHCPLLPSTRNMLAMPEFRRMTKRPLIINCGRGGLVDEADLVEALDLGLISGIGFDCLTSEPPKPENPLLKVMVRLNVIVTPHVAWASAEAVEAVWRQLIGHIENFHAGLPSNVIGAVVQPVAPTTAANPTHGS
jgi:glycerate dehydrogenase